MPVDPALVGHETQPETDTIRAEDIRQFADAIGDNNSIFRDPAAAERAGFRAEPVTPTFVTRYRVSFAEAGLDPKHSQVLHGEQEYEYTRPLVVGDTLIVRHRVASIRQTSRKDHMAVMTLEQLGDDAGGVRVVTGRATVVVRDMLPEGTTEQGQAAAAPASRPGKLDPDGEPIPPLTKHVTQEQIDAYAKVSGDHNPIHIDPEAARAVGLGGTIAHGMLSMAFLGEALTDWLSASDVRGGWVARLRARFAAMVRPGDMLTVRGVVTGRDGERQRVELWVDNAQGERILTGDADVVLPAG